MLLLFKAPLKLVGLLSVVLALTLLCILFLGWATWKLPGVPERLDAEATDGTAGIDGNEVEPIPIPANTHTVGEWDPENEREFSESPDLRKAVDRGALPPVAERLPKNPLVITPPDQVGPYGGTWRRSATSVNDMGTAFNRIAYEGLVRWDPSGNHILPNLAVDWDVEDDGRVFTFQLRRGIRWSDGEPFTAADVVFWYEHVLQNREITPVVPVHFERGGELMELVRLDEYTIQIRFTERYGLFLERLASGHSMEMVQFPEHYMKQFHREFVPEAKLDRLTRAANFVSWELLFDNRAQWRNAEKPTLAAWTVVRPPPASPAIFERNPYYWKVDPQGNQLPYINRISFDIRNADLINFRMLGGRLDMQGRHIEFQNFPLLIENQKEHRYRVMEWRKSGAADIILAPNLNHADPVLREVITDRRFRKALSISFDRQAINEVAFFGMGVPRQAAPPKTSRFYNERYAYAYTEYNKEEANRLLDEMGLTERNDRGIRLLPDGRPLHLQIDYTRIASDPATFALVADGWRDVGISVHIREQAREIFIRRVHARQHDVAVWGGADEQNPLMDPRWFLPFSPSSFQAVSYARWFETRGRRGEEPPPDIRRCIALYWEIEQTADLDRRIQLFQEIIELNLENLWTIGVIGEVPALYVVSNRMVNVPNRAVTGWIYRTPGNTAPECYALSE